MLTIKRLHLGQADGYSYHLYDEAQQLVCVADYGAPWSPVAQVRFARPGGEPMATLDLSQPSTTVANGRQRQSYAIIHDYAVYALVTRYHDPVPTGLDPVCPDYFVLDVDGMSWLALAQPTADPFLTLYDQIPADLEVCAEPLTADLPPPIGHLRQGHGPDDLLAVLPERPLQQPLLIALTLAFLADHATVTPTAPQVGQEIVGR